MRRYSLYLSLLLYCLTGMSCGLGRTTYVGKYRGREFKKKTTLPSAVVKGRAFLVKNRVYLVVVNKPKDDLEPDESEQMDTFLNSFKLIKEI